MKYKKFVVIFFVGIILLSIFPQIPAEPTERDSLFYKFFSRFDKFFSRFFTWSTKSGYITRLQHPGFILGFLLSDQIVGWKPFRLTTPPLFTANPSSIDIRYLDNTEITITSENYQKQLIAQKEIFTFDLEFPENISKDIWFYTFDPPVIYPTGEGEENITTKLNITTKIPIDQTIIPKNLTFRVKATRHITFGFLFAIPPGTHWLFGEQRQNMYVTWALIAALAGWGFRLSGKTERDTVSLDIMVRENRFHLAEIVAPEKVEIGPNRLISIPLEVINLGSHVDVFNFRASTDSKLLVSPPPPITLQPNEVGHTSIGVASLRLFNDPGSARSINIEAYSIYEPETVFNNTATVITRGVYVSEVITFYFTNFIGLIVLIAAFIFYRRRRFLKKMCKKPDKPWTIPEEKKHLKEMKKKDKNKFEKVRLMMEDEYKSAMLWYNDYCYYLIKQKKKEKKPIFKLKEKKEVKRKKEKIKTIDKKIQKESVGTKLTSFFKKTEKKVPKQPKKGKKPLKKEVKVEDDQRIKEKLLLKILREQKKQKRKLKI